MWNLNEVYYRRRNYDYEKAVADYCNITSRLWRPVWFEALADASVYKFPNRDMISDRIGYSYNNIQGVFISKYNKLYRTTDRSDNRFYIGRGYIANNNGTGLLVCRNAINKSIRIYASYEFVNKDSMYKNLYKRVNDEFILPHVAQGAQFLIVKSIEDIFIDKIPSPEFKDFAEMQNYYSSLGKLVYNERSQ